MGVNFYQHSLSDNLIQELWDKKSLVLLFAINDVKLRYKNSVLGFLWTFLEPLLMLTVLYLVFTHIIRAEIELFPLYLLLGLIIWFMFARATSMGLTSLVNKSGIIKQVYIRREIFVVSSTLTSFIMMFFEFAAFAVFLVVFQFVPPATALILPLLLIDLFFLSLGISFFLSVLYVKFRDIGFIWQVVLQAGFFLSPIFYRMDMLPDNIREILQINPLVPILNMARNVVLYDILPTEKASIYIVSITAVIFVIVQKHSKTSRFVH